VIGDGGDDFDRQSSQSHAEEQIAKAMLKARDQDERSDPRSDVMHLPRHLQPPRDERELLSPALNLEKGCEIENCSHKKAVGLGIAVVFGFGDEASAFGQEAGDGGHHPDAIGARECEYQAHAIRFRREGMSSVS